MSTTDDPNYLLLQATQDLQMPEGAEPRTMRAGQVMAFHKSLLGMSEIEQMIRSGLLQAVPAVSSGEIAREVIEALKANPRVFGQVEAFFRQRLVQELKESQRYHANRGWAAQAPAKHSREDLLEMARAGTLSNADLHKMLMK